jgi:2-amino-4-deoxychorismate synthase
MTGQDTDMAAGDLLDRVLEPEPPAFALIHRPAQGNAAMLDVLIGDMSVSDTVSSIPSRRRPDDGPEAGHEVLAILPYRQISERGLSCADDRAPLLVMSITYQEMLPVSAALQRLPQVQTRLVNGHFDVDDDAYADTVGRIIAEEIGQGAGANFVIKRSFVADVSDYTMHSALAIFRRLLAQEAGAYWTFIVHTGTRVLVGATPERHVTLHDGTVVMNPISGTYRYPSSGPTLEEVMSFLGDRKETEELYMVLDEELKMMAGIADSGIRVVGPHLREMTHLAHTEYFIEGRSTLDPREVLRETMYAPTVTGSPLENACRVIARYEPRGRGYYAGVVALIGCDAEGRPTLDSSILIRTADIDTHGRVVIGVGATLVRHSDPHSEVAETHAKAAALLSAFSADQHNHHFGDHPTVRAALTSRNATIAKFWLAGEEAQSTTEPMLVGRRVLIVDAEDMFTSMLALQLRKIGLSVTVSRFDEPHAHDGYDLVVMGPGPGDPRDMGVPRIAALWSELDTLLAQRRPFLAICLSHQLLSLRLGFRLIRRGSPNQGTQREIDLFGRRARVGFYNTFAACSHEDGVDCGGSGWVAVSRDIETGEVHALRGSHFASMQFHPESVLTQDGVGLLATMMKEVLHPCE